MTEIMRQRDDLAFAIALNNMAVGRMTSMDIELINSRCYSINTLPIEAHGAIHLFATNNEVDKYNNQVLSRMNTEGYSVKALDVVSGAPNPQAARKALQSVNTLPTMQTYGLPKNLFLRVGARYMVTVNIDTTDGLVNGTTGILKAIDYGRHKKTSEKRPLRIWVLFDKSTGIATRMQRTQFPIVPAEGITIHKSQGATLEKVVVHISKNVKRSMLYVACSRAMSSFGLFLVVNSGTFKPPSEISESSATLDSDADFVRNSDPGLVFDFGPDSSFHFYSPWSLEFQYR
ncbi:ATP-dependent DNA helicase PIF1 [Eumeta japonica]|uniref:ATP-dependent DNA helicase PIF1 n=1 Tax=Eumeta variegata TaxID=151549 RepID=A0A4C1X8U5_EUMVA|nr:ATP-dependent DNA helicase PIF1 [Eumeta japonica]